MPSRGEERARDSRLDELIEGHLSLVHAVVLQVSAPFPRHVDREELARAGVLGLVEAAHRFDPSRGIPFDKFAASRIRGAILDSARKADWAPRSLRASARAVEEVRQRVTSELGHAPSRTQLASELGISEEKLAEVQERISRAVVGTLNEAVGSDEEDRVELIELIADRTAGDPADLAENNELHQYLRAAVKHLPERHRLVIIGYFIEARTSDDLARFLGVTESRVSQIRSEALEMLREGIEAQYADGGDAPRSVGRVAKRKERYATAIADELSRDRPGRQASA